MRWFLVAAITLPALATLYIGSGLASLRTTNFWFTAALFASNGVLYALARSRRSLQYFRILGICILTIDTLFITYFIYSLGGIESRSIILYTLPIIMAASLFGRRGLYTVAIGSALGYNTVILGNFFEWLQSPQAVTNQAHNGTYVVNTIVFFNVVLVLVAILVDFLTRLLVRKEREARRTAAALRRAQAIAKLGSWEWDVTRNETTWSDEIYTILGVPQARESGTYESYLARVHPDDRQKTDAAVKRAIRDHLPFSLDHRVLHTNKSIHMIHVECKVLVNKSGNVYRIYGTLQDVTAERLLERAKGDFVSLASHQLRTPASGVRMLLAMLRDGYYGKLNAVQQRSVNQAFEANERLLHIADDLLNVAKLESGRIALNRQDYDLASWLAAVCVQQKLLAKQHKIRLQLVAPIESVTAYVDKERLTMVLDNLLSNAFKYTPARGVVTVKLAATKRYVNLSVNDTGSGMTRGEVAQLFGKFTRLDNPASRGTEGTGLGLYLVKSIIDLHGGSITVRSKPGIGSLFTVRLPRGIHANVTRQ